MIFSFTFACFNVIDRDVEVRKDVQVWKNHSVQSQVQEVDAKPRFSFVVVLCRLYCDLMPRVEPDLKTLLHLCVRNPKQSSRDHRYLLWKQNRGVSYSNRNILSSRIDFLLRCRGLSEVFFYSHLSICLLRITFKKSVMVTDSVEKVTLKLALTEVSGDVLQEQVLGFLCLGTHCKGSVWCV